MYLVLTASQDTYITNKIINNSFRATDANVGGAGTLDLFKLYDESKITGESTPVEISKILIKFDLGKLKNMHSKGKIDISSSKFKANIKLHDVYGGQTTPNNFRIICRPLSQSFDEGYGRDVVTFSDIGNSNYITASYLNGQVYAWNQSGANSSGSLGDENIDVISSGTLSGISTNFSSEQFFVKGEEDLFIDVTNAVSGAVSNQMPDHGFIIEYSGSYSKDNKTYFVKRFASRNSSRSDIYPKLVIRYDDSIIDNHSNFIFDASGSIFLRNTVRNVLTNIKSGSASTEITGQDSLLVKLVSGSYQKIITASQHTLGSNQVTGVYSASFAISAYSGSLSQFSGVTNPNSTLQKEINSAGSASFDVIWSSLDESVGYFTGSLVIKSPFRTNENVEGDRYLLTVKNLSERYRQNDVAVIRTFVENRNKEIKFVKKPIENKSEIFSNMHFQIRDSETKKIIIPFDISLNSTRMSADQKGMYFELHMSSLPRGKSYELEFLIRDFGNDIFIQNSAGKFVID